VRSASFLQQALVAALATLLCFPFVAAAQGTYPDRPVRILVPFAPGGATDILARALAAKLADRMGQQFVVENRGGAGGNLGTEAAAKAAPDGYTLLMGFDGTMTINPHVYPSLPFDPVRDFEPITKVADVPVLIVANAALSLTSLQDIGALAKRRGSAVTFSSAGQGSTGHLAGELLARELQVPMTHIPYKGGGQAIADVVSGQVDLLFAAIPASQGQVKAGRLKALAVTSRTRSAALPDVPTVAESGVKGFDVQSWYGLLAPRGTPRPVIERLHREAVAALADTELRARLEQLGAVPVGNTPEQFAADMRADLARWGPVVKAAGIRAE
jgi:tripartite-type tricarboxylate transporter receptor subunit TctC